MKLYGFSNSRSFRIIWMFKELGIEFDYERLDPDRGDLESDSFLNLNPAGKVPVLVDNNLVLTESAAIITYLGDKYPDLQLVPSCHTEARARYNQWCFFALTELEQPLWSIVKHQFVLPEKYRISEMNRTSLYEFRQALDILAQGLVNSKWILGEHFSAADILIGHSLHWARENKIKLKNSAIDQYYLQLSKRKAFKQSLTFT